MNPTLLNNNWYL